MTFTRPTTRFGAPPTRPIPRADFRERIAAQLAARMLPTMTPDERFAFEERVAICTFDGGLVEADATRVALNDCAAQRPRSQQCSKQ